jgi:Protein of unknown function (DUF1214)
MYDQTYNLVDNPINRYAIGNRTPNLKKDNDGGLTLYIQSDSPGQDKESNWLPSTKSGSFFMLLRTYLPGLEIVEQKWAPPGVVKVNCSPSIALAIVRQKIPRPRPIPRMAFSLVRLTVSGRFVGLPASWLFATSIITPLSKRPGAPERIVHLPMRVFH